MDERIEYQLMWLEEAVSRVDQEAKVLAAMVEGGQELVEELRQCVAATHMQVETIKGELRLRPVEVKEKVEEVKKDSREPPTEEVAPPKPKPKRKAASKSLYQQYQAELGAKPPELKEKDEVKEDRPEAS